MTGQDLVVAEQREVAVPVALVSIDDIAVLDTATAGINQAREEAIKKGKDVVHQAINDAAVPVIRRKFWKPWETISYEELTADFLNGQLPQIIRDSTKGLFPEKLEELCWSYKVGSISKKVGSLLDKIDELLDYVFVSPVSQLLWEKQLEETVSSGADLTSNTRYEQGRSVKQMMSLVTSPLKQEHVDYLVGKLYSAVDGFNKQVRTYAEMVKDYVKGEFDPDLRNDLSIMNHCLESMRQPEGRVNLGLYAHLLRKVVSKIHTKIERITSSLSNAASNFYDMISYHFKCDACYATGFKDQASLMCSYRYARRHVDQTQTGK